MEGDDQDGSSAPTAVEVAGRETPAPVVRRGARASIGMRYELGAEIARGGMGRVVDAKDTLLGRSVAIKEALTTDDEILRRFARETRITARLEHPSIVPVHDAGTLQDGSPFYVMRKVTGQPLEGLVVEAKSLPKRLALLPNLLAAANAVAHAHHRGVLHRDLKPSNILVGDLGETVVIDWGLAKVIDEADDPADASRADDGVHTRLGSVVGTPGFMPPEQLRGDPVDARSDVYALGATMYFVLARRSPHLGRTGDEIMAAALDAPPTPIGELVPGVPRELATIIDKALAYDRDTRYLDAGGLAADLDRFLKGQLVASHRYSPRERVARFLRRHRIAVAVAAVAAVAIAIGAWVAIARVVRERDRADVALKDALDRNEALELSRAWAELPTNPTAALARIKPLAGSHWRDVRSLAMAARAAGVAYAIKGPPHILSLELSPDGTEVLFTGDRSVDVVDLHSHSGRVAMALTGQAHAHFSGRSVIAWAGTHLDIGGRVLELPTEPVDLRVVGRTLWWCDRDGAVWMLQIAGTTPTRIAIDDRITILAPHGDDLALGGAAHTWLIHTGVIARLSDGTATALAWSNDGKLAAIVGTRVEEYDREGKLATKTEQPDARCIAWQGDALYIGGDGTITRRGSPPLSIGDQPIVELFPGPRDSIVARSKIGALLVIGPHVMIDIPATSAIGAIAASPTSSYLVAGSNGIVLTWNLDDVLPLDIPIGRPMTHRFGGYDQLVVVHDLKSATWVDVPTGNRYDVELPGLLVNVVFAPDHTHALFVTDGGAARLYTRGERTGTAIAPIVANAAFATNDNLVITTRSNNVIAYSITTQTITPWLHAPALGAELQVRGDWALIGFTDGSAVRRNLVTDAMTTLPKTAERYSLLQDHGDVVTTDSQVLALWHADDTTERLPALPTPLSWILRADATHVLVLAGGDSAHLVQLDGPRKTTTRFLPGSKIIDLVLDGPLGVYSDGTARIFVTDALAGTSWRLGRPRVEPLEKPAISDDGRRISAVAGTSVVVWTQPVVETAEGTIAIVNGLTNAHTVGTTDELGWD